MRGDSPQPLERGKNMDIETKRAKHNEYQRRYRERHKERVKEQAKRWRDSHKEQLKLKFVDRDLLCERLEQLKEQK